MQSWLKLEGIIPGEGFVHNFVFSITNTEYS